MAHKSFAKAFVSNKDPITESSALVAFKHLLETDLDDIKYSQEENAKADLAEHPSNLKLLSAVKRWARAIGDRCRSCAAKCPEIDLGDASRPVMGIILIVISDHLRLPPDLTLLFPDWPENNGVRDFVLEVGGAPVDLVSGKFVVQPTLPRWEPKSRFARRIAGLRVDPPKNSPFLSIDETRDVVRGIEESFRTTLFSRLRLVESQIVLHSSTEASSFPSHDSTPPEILNLLRFDSELKTQVAFYIFLHHPHDRDRDIETHLRRNHPELIPLGWGSEPAAPGKLFTKVRRSLRDRGVLPKKLVNHH
jgi:hypothetical protein